MTRLALEAVTTTAADGTVLLRDVTFTAEPGELIVLVGPSGSGKSSVIRSIAGLERVTAGRIRFDGQDVTELPTRERDVGIVFQSQALFPSQRAAANVGFPLRIRKISREETTNRVLAEARSLGIEHILDRWPPELSAGHQQLVQIARALVRVPNVLLLDEPMAHLDLPMRTRLRRDLKELQRGYGVTTVHATNDPDEAMAMADRIVAIEGGELVQIGTPAELQAAPVDTHLAWLTGAISFVDAKVERDSTGFWLVSDHLRVRAWSPELGRHVGRTVRLGIRPQHVRAEPGSPLRVEVVGPTFESGAPATRLRLGDDTITAVSIDERPGSALDVTIERYLVYGVDGQLITTVGRP